MLAKQTVHSHDDAKNIRLQKQLSYILAEQYRDIRGVLGHFFSIAAHVKTGIFLPSLPALNWCCEYGTYFCFGLLWSDCPPLQSPPYASGLSSITS